MMITKIKNAMFLVVVLAAVILYYMYRGVVSENQRMQSNQNTLLGQVEKYKIQDSLSAVSVGVLKLSLLEMEEYRAKDKQTIKELGIRLKRVENFSRVSLKSSYDFKVVMVDSSLMYRSGWMNFDAQLRSDSLSGNFVVYDTIVQVLHRVPRFKFLGICFGTKGVRQEIISKNPNTKITAAEYIEIQ